MPHYKVIEETKSQVSERKIDFSLVNHEITKDTRFISAKFLLELTETLREETKPHLLRMMCFVGTTENAVKSTRTGGVLVIKSELYEFLGVSARAGKRIMDDLIDNNACRFFKSILSSNQKKSGLKSHLVVSFNPELIRAQKDISKGVYELFNIEPYTPAEKVITDRFGDKVSI